MGAVERVAAEPHPDPWKTVVVKIPAPAMRIVSEAFDRYWEHHEPPPSVGAAWGLMLEALAADYIAGPNPEGW